MCLIWDRLTSCADVRPVQPRVKLGASDRKERYAEGRVAGERRRLSTRAFPLWQGGRHYYANREAHGSVSGHLHVLLRPGDRHARVRDVLDLFCQNAREKARKVREEARKIWEKARKVREKAGKGISTGWIVRTDRTPNFVHMSTVLGRDFPPLRRSCTAASYAIPEMKGEMPTLCRVPACGSSRHSRRYSKGLFRRMLDDSVAARSRGERGNLACSKGFLARGNCTIAGVKGFVTQDRVMADRMLLVTAESPVAMVRLKMRPSPCCSFLAIPGEPATCLSCR